MGIRYLLLPQLRAGDPPAAQDDPKTHLQYKKEREKKKLENKEKNETQN